MWNDIIDLVKAKQEPTWKSVKQFNIDIVDLKEAVKDGAISFYIKDNVIYCKNKTGEVVKVGIVDER